MFRTAAFLGVASVAFAASSTLAARSLEALQTPDPARETAAQANVGFAASCRAAARELLGQGSFTFERPSYAMRDGEAIVRMDVTVPGLGGDGMFRAVCVRDARTGAVDAAIFDAPADGIGPRVISLGPPPQAAASGEPAASAARKASPDSVIAYNYSGPDPGLAYGGYDPSYWGSFLPFDGRDFRRHRPHHRDALDLRQRSDRLPRFVAPRHHGTGFRSQGGTRLGVGGFIR